MSAISKERLIKIQQWRETYGPGSNVVLPAEEAEELARIALASLEAEPAIHRWRRVTVEPYGTYPWHYGNFIGFSKPVEGIEDEYFYSASPAPVSVPAAYEHTEDFSEYHEGWNACRAAMLQGAEPVTTAYKLPFEQWLSQQGERIEMDCGCVGVEVFMHWLRMAYGASNSPVIPDDVRRMDWLVSKTVDVREPMVYGSHSLFWSQTITNEEDDYHATKLREQIDAAMAAEQAAAPLQEVK